MSEEKLSEPTSPPNPLSNALERGSNTNLEEFEIAPGLSVVVDVSHYRVKSAMKVDPQAGFVRVKLDLKIEIAGGQEAKVENIFSAEYRP